MPSAELLESVLVVPRTVIDPLCPPTGFSKQADQLVPAILTNCSFMERNRAEHDFQYKQVIPYVVVRHQERFLLLRRSTKQAESRLHNKYSLGVGGHINDSDVSNGHDVITAGMRRELTEEIRLEAEQSSHLVGVINDDSTEVARVHVGLVYLLTAASQHYTIMEPDKHTAEWRLPTEITAHYEQLESWSQIVHDHLVVPLSADLMSRRALQT